MVPSSVPLNLNTDTVDIILPGIKAYYGAGLPVDVRFNVTTLGNFLVSEADEEMSGTTSLALEFWVEQANGTTEMAANV